LPEDEDAIESETESGKAKAPAGFERVDVSLRGQVVPWIQVSSWVTRLGGDYALLWQILHYASEKMKAKNVGGYVHTILENKDYSAARESITVANAMDWRDELYTKGK
jgi:hypothetical protein